jgi:hypothetical protein
MSMRAFILASVSSLSKRRFEREESSNENSTFEQMRQATLPFTSNLINQNSNENNFYARNLFWSGDFPPFS